MKEAEKIYVCARPDCTRKFLKKEDLVEHIRQHNLILKWACQECYSRFATESELQLHDKLHEEHHKGLYRKQQAYVRRKSKSKQRLIPRGKKGFAQIERKKTKEKDIEVSNLKLLLEQQRSVSTAIAIRLVKQNQINNSEKESLLQRLVESQKMITNTVAALGAHVGDSVSSVQAETTQKPQPLTNTSIPENVRPATLSPFVPTISLVTGMANVAPLGSMPSSSSNTGISSELLGFSSSSNSEQEQQQEDNALPNQ